MRANTHGASPIREYRSMSHIAIVEDNPDNQMLLMALLEDDYALTCYGDGPSALNGLIEAPPDLVLLDISLPGMDGVEVLRRLREQGALAGLPVVALTAHAMEGDRERFLSAGFDGYLAKPIVDEEELLSCIEDNLARRSAPT